MFYMISASVYFLNYAYSHPRHLWNFHGVACGHRQAARAPGERQRQKCVSPMSTQLEELGIELMEGYHPEHLQPKPDLVIIGNALSRQSGRRNSSA